MTSVWAVSALLDISWLYNNTVGVVVSMSVGYLVSLTAPAPSQDQLSDVMMAEAAPDMQAVLAARDDNAQVIGKDAPAAKKRLQRLGAYTCEPAWLRLWAGRLGRGCSLLRKCAAHCY